MAGAGEAFAFLPSLPLDVVLHLTEVMAVPDVLRCMAVCRAWHRTLTRPEMARFWQRACEFVCLPRYWLSEEMRTLRSPQEMFQAAREHRAHVCAITPSLKRFAGSHPFESTLKCKYAGEGFFVKTIDYPTLDHEETIIGRLCAETAEIVRVDTVAESYGEVQWASLVGRNVVWCTAKPKAALFRYDLDTRESARLQQGQLLQGCSETLGHCQRCLLFVVVGTENSLHGYSWRLHFLRFAAPGAAAATCTPAQSRYTVSIPPNHTQFVPRPVKALFLPEDDCCCSHRLILQGGASACVFHIENGENGEVRLNSRPIASLNPFHDSDVTVMVVNMSSEMVLSWDGQLVGMVTSIVYPFISGLCLHIFDLGSYRRIISVCVDWKDSNFSDAEVLAVSGLYTIIGVGHSRGVVKVVESRSGRVLVEQCGLGGRSLPPVLPISHLLQVHFQGVFNEQALVDVLSPLQLVVLYRKGQRNMEGVFFHPFPKQLSPSRRTAGRGSGDSDDADQEGSVSVH